MLASKPSPDRSSVVLPAALSLPASIITTAFQRTSHRTATTLPSPKRRSSSTTTLTHRRLSDSREWVPRPTASVSRPPCRFPRPRRPATTITFSSSNTPPALADVWPRMHRQYLLQLLSQLCSPSTSPPTTVYVSIGLQDEGAFAFTQYDSVEQALAGVDFGGGEARQSRVTPDRVWAAAQFLAGQPMPCIRHLVLVAASPLPAKSTPVDPWHAVESLLVKEHVYLQLALTANLQEGPLVRLFERTLRAQRHTEEPLWLKTYATDIFCRLSVLKRPEAQGCEVLRPSNEDPARHALLPVPPDLAPLLHPNANDPMPPLVSRIQQKHGINRKKHGYSEGPAKMLFLVDDGTSEMAEYRPEVGGEPRKRRRKAATKPKAPPKPKGPPKTPRGRKKAQSAAPQTPFPDPWASPSVDAVPPGQDALAAMQALPDDPYFVLVEGSGSGSSSSAYSPHVPVTPDAAPNGPLEEPGPGPAVVSDSQPMFDYELEGSLHYHYGGHPAHGVYYDVDGYARDLELTYAYAYASGHAGWPTSELYNEQLPLLAQNPLDGEELEHADASLAPNTLDEMVPRTFVREPEYELDVNTGLPAGGHQARMSSSLAGWAG
ncbi:hypothetical protein MIND_01312500 [Mycena indigotica]|uniref:Uncharacterized protein n=1 Tax=Mycena indigotica TaxID=2126181 RepID=A0A8H6VUM8_9AGAR|nr:uncharacterized protein MIND_01312500 [Mycena indigotica]KAF7290718.1 hypothetical protein MIND_01312500 [Mycena indigotica]